jgi:FAD/FMN-containing dehydrogenase
MGGGHSVLGPTVGLAADNIVEVSVVTPAGDVVVANECQNSDVFWAVRGGGGGTFGVVLNLTEKAYPATAVSTANLYIGSTQPLNATDFWYAAAELYGAYPGFGDVSLMAYGSVVVGNETVGPSLTANFFGVDKTVNETAALLQPVLDRINATYGGAVVIYDGYAPYTTFYDYWSNNLDDFGSPGTPLGIDILAGSRLLDAAALTRADLPELLFRAANPNGVQMFLVSGKGVHQHAGDFNSVQPSWRTSYVHAGKLTSCV